MKKNILSLMAILLSIAFLAACGGGSGSGSVPKRLRTNEYLGDLPAAAYHHEMMDSIVEADAGEQIMKIGDKITMEKAQNIKLRLDVKKEENLRAWDIVFEKEKEKLLNKDIPFEVKAPNYKIDYLKISKVNPQSVYLKGEVAFTEETTVNSIGMVRQYELYYVVLDKNNEIIGRGSKATPANGKNLARQGEKYEFEFLLLFKNKEVQYADFAKLSFMTKEEYNTIPK